MSKNLENNEKAAWDKLQATQKSFVVRVLNWFHFRPTRIARSWVREEVLTWEFLRALKVLLLVRDEN
ncbi:MAG: hypothetical protein A3G80_06190 [Betaproteobacteria bacterium RIFCSPLOWO2_12_FULL_62_13b]|nr:MAG: hypothetical protein A3G80_06190 [Betaproteobacteria bacterium RIFCSPLOWO2_12_FULL_62_13b]